MPAVRLRALDSWRWIVACALLATMVAGCTRAVNRSAERRIRDALRDLIGPARAWNAHIDSPAEATLRGRLGSVQIDGEEVRLPNGLTVDDLQVDLRGVDVDTRRHSLRHVDATTFSASIGEAGLNGWLRAEPPPASEAVRMEAVDLRGPEVVVHATRWLIGRAWPFTITAEPRLEPSSPARIAFDPDNMTVLGLPLPLPAAVLRWIAGRLDVGFDLGVLPFPVRLSSVSVARGRLALAGMADVTDVLNRRMAR